MNEYNRPLVIWPLFIQNLEFKMTVLLEYFNGVYGASIITCTNIFIIA